MADRWDERNRSNFRDDRADRPDRGMVDRASDEVRSWAGDDEAARRRRMDEMRDDSRDRDQGRGENAWGRAREGIRDATDRDRDGRRGLSEWNDSDRPSYRGGGEDWTNAGHGVSGRDASYWGRERGYEPDRFGSSPDQRPMRYDTGDSSARRRHGTDYTGRGPRGYQRGDERIREDVCDRLTDDPRIDAEDIDIAVRQGEVTLSGSVRSRDEKRFTEDLIERITGVREVNNNLKVRRSDEVLGTARSGASVLGLSDNPPPPPSTDKK